MKRLKHEAHVRPRRAARPSSSSSVKSTPAINTRPVLGESNPAKQRQQCRFARARGADDGQGFAGSHAEADIGENGQLNLPDWRPSWKHSSFENDLILHRERL
jgi:hypothetical protein